MKKIITIFLLSILPYYCAYAKYSPQAQILLKESSATMQRAKQKVANSYIHTTLATTDISVLEEYDIIVGTQAAGYVTALVPVSVFPLLNDIEQITYVDAGSTSHTTLDVALPIINYNKILETPYMAPYMGQGVIVGIVDIGFQWDHASFRNPDGSTRILSAWNQNDTTGTSPEPYGYGSVYDTQEEIYTAQVCTVETHGTHVASIAAGSDYEGLPYSGVATQASLILVEAEHNESGGISNGGIVDGIDYIFQQAEKLGMPCVINLSIGNLFGPHDGTSAFDRMCDEMQGEGRLIVGAIGNSGDEYYHCGHTFTEPDEVRLGIRSYNSTLPIIDVWSSSPIECNLELYHAHVDTMISCTGWLPLDSLYETTLSFYDREILVEAASEVYKENNQYHTFILTSGLRNYSNAYMALRIKGENGPVNVWLNSPGCQFNQLGHDDWLGGDLEMTLNETGGTGKRITSVGSFTTDTLKENQRKYEVEYELYAASPFSGRGYTVDGRMKPEISAPGCIITAGLSSVLAGDPNNYFWNMVTDSCIIAEKTYYYGSNSGTSMAAPIVTGTYALWLQAEPSLSPEEAKEVLRITATQDAYTTDATATGYGKINPYAGLSYLLEANNIVTPYITNNTVIYPTTGKGNFSITSSSNNIIIAVQIYNSAGMLIKTQNVDNDNHTAQLNIPSTSKGIYYIRVITDNGCHTHKYILQ